ncbi:MAG: maleylacetoacetate isomerase [Gammaproteobacteria bacterium]|nr:maleylacetoacetate isomerase [Gammaproteobacteria bacterium]
MLDLYDFHLSSASHRVRIGLRLKGLDYRSLPTSLVKGGGQQHLPEYRSLNPQGMVPVLVDDEFILSQSLAILEYLDELWPTPPFLPSEPAARARQFAQLIVSDIQSLTNLRVLAYLRTTLKATDVQRSLWFRHWLLEGLDALELWLTAEGHVQHYALGSAVTLADICLVPLITSARRFGLPLDDFPRLCTIETQCMELDAFRLAHPDQQTSE